MDYFFSPYELRYRNGSGVQQGTLIKVRGGDFWGVADLSPRPELGDKSWQVEIKSRGELFMRSVDLAKEDLAARSEGRSLLADKPIENNWLLTDYSAVDFNEPRFSGRSLKIKAGRNFSELTEKINSCGANVRLRIDFNAKLTTDMFETFLATLKNRKCIEYIEDPTPLCEQWVRWNQIIPLAFDFQRSPYSSNFAKYRIIKPTRQYVPDNMDNVTLTSAMDHAVGLAHGLRIAQGCARGESGFLTLDLYEANGFESYFEQRGTTLNFSKLALQDTGIGMGELLQKLKWIREEEL